MYTLKIIYMILFSVDLGSVNLGYSLIETENTSETPTLVKLIKAEYMHLTAPKIGDRLNIVLKRFEKEIEDNMVDMIIYENSVFRGGQAPALYQVAGIFHLVSSIYGLPIFDPKPTQIKKLICGSGKAGKKDIELAANKWLTNPPESYINDHVSDAVSIGVYGYLRYQMNQKDWIPD